MLARAGARTWRLSGWRLRLSIAASALLTVLLYLPGLRVGFLADDFLILEMGTASPQVWLENLAYRFQPLHTASVIIAGALFGLDPVPYHAMSILLHAAVTLLVGYVALLLVQRADAAILSSAVFGFLPRQHTVALWMAANVYSFMAVFYLLAFALFWKYLRTGRQLPYVASQIAFAAALGFQEAAATLPIILVLAELTLLPADDALRPSRLVAFVRSGAYLKYLPMVALVVASRVLAHLARVAANYDASTNGYGFVAPSGRTLVSLVSYLVYQINPYLTLKSLQPTFASAAIAGASLALFAVWFARGGRIDRFWWLWTLVNFVPFVLFSPFGNDDRYFYLSAVGYAVLIGSALPRLAERLAAYRARAGGVVGVAAVAAVLSSSALLTGARIGDWQRASEEADRVIAQIQALRPDVSATAQIYLVDMPITHGRAFVLEPGSSAALRLAYGVPSLRVNHTREPAVSALVQNRAWDASSDGDVFVFRYAGGQISDVSSAYAVARQVFDDALWYPW